MVEEDILEVGKWGVGGDCVGWGCDRVDQSRWWRIQVRKECEIEV